METVNLRMNLKFDYNWSSWNEIDSVLQSASNKEKGDFFDRENIIKWLPFEEARDYVRQLNIENSLDWAKYAKSGDKPKKIPAKPRKVYKDKGWISMPDWLGTDD